MFKHVKVVFSYEMIVGEITVKSPSENGVNTNGVTATFMFVDKRYFSVLPSNLCASGSGVLF